MFVQKNESQNTDQKHFGLNFISIAQYDSVLSVRNYATENNISNSKDFLIINF